MNALYFLDQSSDAPAQLAISASTNRTHRLFLLHLSDYSMLELKGARAKISQVFATGNSVYAAGGKSILAWPRTGGKAAALFQCDHNSQLVGLHNSILVIKQSDKMLSAIDRHNGEERWQHPLITYSMVCMRQNRLAIDYRGELLILDSERGDLIQKTTCAPFVSNIALNHRADRLSLSGHGHRINHWSLDNAEITPANNPDGEIKQLYIIDSERWVSAHNDQILFWNKHHHQPYKTIYPSSISFNTFVIDDEREQLWVAGSKLQCYCLNSGKLLSNFVNHYPTPCRVLRIIDDRRLLFVSEGGRRNLGHLLVVSRDNGEVLHRERIEMMFFDAVREGNNFYLSAKSGPQYRFDVSDYSYTRVTDYASRLSHGGLYINHNPIRTATPLHQVYIEYGAEPDLPESQNRCCIFTATDVNNDRLMIPQLRFDDLITCAHIFADDKRAVLAMRKKEKTSPSQPQYLQVVELESAAVTARLTLDIEGINDAYIDLLYPVNENEVFVGYNNGIILLVRFK
ncbi:hypothetical protein [Photobacterium atrarenae]|uniref:Uncharacterized protein n=1 Tax=Photobacterium atrarenae TaxID=865757 RepID=A0ABY5GL63_9GAMM|nr:hypothetical protein [Photobacterium atrarenae]UTV29916.1 hypothetical protein NNL38_23225 [Photobacterium atrarenae]